MTKKLTVIAHPNNEVTVLDERGLPVLCLDCRYSGWLTGYEHKEHSYPRTCLLYSGGADVRDGDRVIFDDHGVGHGYDSANRREHEEIAKDWRKPYPLCEAKNAEGKCQEFVRARTLPWWRLRRWIRPWRTRKMRT